MSGGSNPHVIHVYAQLSNCFSSATQPADAGFFLRVVHGDQMRKATARRNNCALARPWVKPQAGITRTRRKNRDGSVTVFTVDVDRHGVIRRRTTTLVPN